VMFVGSDSIDSRNWYRRVIKFLDTVRKLLWLPPLPRRNGLFGEEEKVWYHFVK
jgi:hypothetical protein